MAERQARARSRRPRGTGAAFVYDKLREEILSLRLEPGTLLDETELGRRLEISRSPVREALIRLAAEGLVRTLPNRSSIVSFFDVSEILGFFDALDLMYRVTARGAALHATPDGLAAIKAAAAEHDAAAARGDVLTLVATNRSFHGAIAAASGNPYFAQWTRTLLDNGQRVLRLYMRHAGDRPGREAAGDHQALVEAIERRDADAAEEAARRDAAVTAEEMLAFLGTRHVAGLDVRAPAERRPPKIRAV